ncbi:MAG: DUF86 domain-containing protein [Gemmatimonadota bacterium]|nr:DUF86 domain-containing protein [Gemmatimonadota bacterium]
MSGYDDRASLEDMRNHAREAVLLLGNTSLKELSNNRVLELALRKLVEIVGEAAYRVSVPTRRQHTEFPWRKVIGMRNRIDQGYFDVSIAELWETINNDLLALIEQSETLVKEGE